MYLFSYFAQVYEKIITKHDKCAILLESQKPYINAGCAGVARNASDGARILKERGKCDGLN